MSNLPVLWVPPVTPPDPNERPPKRRRNLGVLAAAVAIVGVPLFAYTVFGETAPKHEKPATVVEAEATTPTAAAATTAGAKPAATALGPSPETSGGNQPYIAGIPAPAPRPATPPSAPAATTSPDPAAAAVEVAAETSKPAVGPDGRPIRVIGIDRPSADMAAAAPAPEKAVSTPEPMKGAVPAEPKPTVVTPPPAATPRVETPIGAAAPRGPLVEPAPAKSPLVEASRPAEVPPAPIVTKPAEEASTAKEAPSIVVRSGAGSSGSSSSATVVSVPAPAPEAVAPRAVEAKTPEPKVAEPPNPEPKAADAGPQKTPLPPKRETAKVIRAGEETARSAEAGAFADRLGAIRRSEAPRPTVRRPVDEPPRPMVRRLVDEPPVEEEDVIVVPRHRWGFLPPFFDDGPRRPALRSYDPPPPREARGDRIVRGENCHYHAWPTEDMAFHRSVKCHWHRDPGDPSIRYVR